MIGFVRNDEDYRSVGQPTDLPIPTHGEVVRALWKQGTTLFTKSNVEILRAWATEFFWVEQPGRPDSPIAVGWFAKHGRRAVVVDSGHDVRLVEV